MPARPLDLRPLTLADAVDRAFRLYRENFLLWFGVAAAFLVPEALLVAPLQPQQAEYNTMGPGALAALGRQALLLPITIAVAGLAQAALSWVVAARYLDRPVTLGAALATAGRRAPRLFLVVLLSGLAAGVAIAVGLLPGGILAILVHPLFAILSLAGLVPGFWVFLGLMYGPAVVVLEPGGVRSAIERSWRLARGGRMRLLLLTLVQGVLWVVASIVTGALIGLVGHSDLATALAQRLASLLVVPITHGALVILYIDARVRKEGFDIQMLTERMAAESRTAGAAASGTGDPTGDNP